MKLRTPSSNFYSKSSISDMDAYKYMARRAAENNIQGFAGGGKVQKHALTWGEQRRLDEQKGKKPQELKGGMTEEERKVLEEVKSIINDLKVSYQEISSFEKEFIEESKIIRKKITNVNLKKHFFDIKSFLGNIGLVINGLKLFSEVLARGQIASDFAGQYEQTLDILKKTKTNILAEIEKTFLILHEIETQILVSELEEKIKNQIAAVPKASLNQNYINNLINQVRTQKQAEVNKDYINRLLNKFNNAKAFIKRLVGIGVILPLEGRDYLSANFSEENAKWVINKANSEIPYAHHQLGNYDSNPVLKYNIPNIDLKYLENNGYISKNQTAEYYNQQIANIKSQENLEIQKIKEKQMLIQNQRLKLVDNIKSFIEKEIRIKDINTIENKAKNDLNLLNNKIAGIETNITQLKNVYSQELKNYKESAAKRDYFYKQGVINGVNAFLWVKSNPTRDFYSFFRDTLKVSDKSPENVKLIKERLYKNLSPYLEEAKRADVYWNKHNETFQKIKNDENKLLEYKKEKVRLAEEARKEQNRNLARKQHAFKIAEEKARKIAEEKRVANVHKTFGQALKIEKQRLAEEVIEEARNILFQISPKKYPVDINQWTSNAKHKFLAKNIKYITDNLPNWRQSLENTREKKRLAEEQKLKKELIEILPKLHPESYPVNYEEWTNQYAKGLLDKGDYKTIEESLPIYRKQLEQKRVAGVHKELGKALKLEKARRDEEVIEEARNILFQISPKKYPVDINQWTSNAKHKFLAKNIKYITDNLPNWRQSLENTREKKRLAEEQRVAEEARKEQNRNLARKQHALGIKAINEEIDALKAEIDKALQEAEKVNYSSEYIPKEYNFNHEEVPSTIEEDEREVLRLIEQAEREQPEGFARKQEIPAQVAGEFNEIIGEPISYEMEETTEPPPQVHINRNVRNLIEENNERLYDKIAEEWLNELERGNTPPLSVNHSEHEKESAEDEGLLTPPAFDDERLGEEEPRAEYAKRLSEELARLEKEQEDFKKNEAALKVQAFFRGRKAREEYARVSKEREAERLNKINALRAEREALEVPNLKGFFNGMSNRNINEKLKQLQEEEFVRENFEQLPLDYPELTEKRAEELFRQKLANVPAISRNIPNLLERLKTESEQEAQDEWLEKNKEIESQNLRDEEELYRQKMQEEGKEEEVENLLSPVELESDKLVNDIENILNQQNQGIEGEYFNSELIDASKKEQEVQENAILNGYIQAELRLKNRERRAASLEDPNYEYEDEDIEDILKANNLGENVGVNIITLQSGDVRKEVFTEGLLNAVTQLKEGKEKVLVPINLGGYHWVSMMLSNSADGISATYNDPLGNPISEDIVKGLTGIGIYNINDLETRQQFGDLNCGAMATNNLIQMAIDQPILNTEEAYNYASQIRENNAKDVANFIGRDVEELQKKQAEVNSLLERRQASIPEEDISVEEERIAPHLISEYVPQLNTNAEEAALLQILNREKEKSKVYPSMALEGKYKRTEKEQLIHDLKNLNIGLTNAGVEERESILKDIKEKKRLLEKKSKEEALKRMARSEYNKTYPLNLAEENRAREEKMNALIARAREREEYRENLMRLSKLGVDDSNFSVSDQNLLNDLRETESRNHLLRLESRLAELKKDMPMEDEIPSPPKSENFDLWKANLSPEELEEMNKSSPSYLNQVAEKKSAAKNMYLKHLEKLKEEGSLAPIPELPEGLTEKDVMKELEEYAASNPKKRLVHLNKLNTDPHYSAEYVKNYLPKKHEAIENPEVAAEINRLHNPKTYERQKAEGERLDRMDKDIDFLLGGTGRQYDKAEVLHKYDLPKTSTAKNYDREVMRRVVRNEARRAAAKSTEPNQFGGAFSGNYGQANNSLPLPSKRRGNPLEFFGKDKFNPYFYAPPVYVN